MKLERAKTWDEAIEQWQDAAERIRATMPPEEIEQKSRALVKRLMATCDAAKARHDAKRRGAQLAEQTDDLLADIRAEWTDQQRWEYAIKTMNGPRR